MEEPGAPEAEADASRQPAALDDAAAASPAPSSSSKKKKKKKKKAGGASPSGGEAAEGEAEAAGACESGLLVVDVSTARVPKHANAVLEVDVETAFAFGLHFEGFAVVETADAAGGGDVPAEAETAAALASLAGLVAKIRVTGLGTVRRLVLACGCGPSRGFGAAVRVRYARCGSWPSWGSVILEATVEERTPRSRAVEGHLLGAVVRAGQALPNWLAARAPLQVAACFGAAIGEQTDDREARGTGCVGEFTRCLVRPAPAVDRQFAALTGGDLAAAAKKLAILGAGVSRPIVLAARANFAKHSFDVPDAVTRFAMRAEAMKTFLIEGTSCAGKSTLAACSALEIANGNPHAVFWLSCSVFFARFGTDIVRELVTELEVAMAAAECRPVVVVLDDLDSWRPAASVGEAPARFLRGFPPNLRRSRSHRSRFG